MTLVKRCFCVFILSWLMLVPESLRAQVTSTSTVKLQSPSFSSAAAPSESQPLGATSQQIDALMKSNLDASVDPASLFDVDINSESAVQLERERLAVYLKNVGKVDSPELQIRLELDAARLQFYSMPQSERSELLRLHFEKRELNAQKSLSTLDEAQQQALEAERAAQRAIEEANRARTEAERLVSEERADLLELSAAQAEFELQLAKEKAALQTRLEQVLQIQRRAREVQRRRDVLVADAFYDDIRTHLKAARIDFSGVVSKYLEASRVPQLSPSKLVHIAAEFEQADLIQKREEIEFNTVRLSNIEKELREAKANQLYDEIRLLNSLRLSLLAELSADKRSAIKGFNLIGFEQAVAEFNHIALELRFRVVSLQQWVFGELSVSSRASSLYSFIFFIFKWLFAISLFIWWRRNGDGVLATLLSQLQQQADKNPSQTSHPLISAVSFFRKVRGVFEWLLLVWWLAWIIPVDTLELDILTTALTWMLGGALVVNIINALSAEQSSGSVPQALRSIADIRLRSLRLVGRTVVILGLLLSLSGQLVGHGTIYHWVVLSCWVSVTPVLLTVIRWWRPAIFERVRSVRKKKGFENWVVANETDWKSFLSAVAAGVYLFVRGGSPHRPQSHRSL